MERKRLAWVGAFVVAGGLLFAVGLFLIGDRRLLFEKQFEIGATFGKVTGVQLGTRVRLAGLEAGEVLEIAVPSRPSERFLVRMRIREDLRQLIRGDSGVAIQTDGLVGAAFIQISTGTDEAPVVQPGAVLAGTDPIEIADLIKEGQNAFRLVSRGVVDVTGDVSNALVALTNIVETTDAVVVKVGDQVERVGTVGMRVADDVGQVVTDVRGVVSGVRAGEGTIGRLFTDTAFYDRMNTIGREAAESARVVRETAEIARTSVAGFVAP